MATRGAASWMMASLNPEAMIWVKKFEKRVTTREKKSKKRANFVKIAAEKTPFCLEAEKEGKKLCVNAPSAKTRRKRLGNLKATIKISV